MKSSSSWIVLGLVLVPFGCGGDAAPGRGDMGQGSAGAGGDDGSEPNAVGGSGAGREPTAVGGGGENGNEPTAATGGQAQGGGQRGDGGEPPLGNAGDATGVAGSGLAEGGAGGAGGAGSEAGAGGEGGVVRSGCRGSADCDDGIACTQDRCNLDSTCSHIPNSSLCEGDPNECRVCEVGVGCVARATTTTELLLDKDFDELSGAWEEDSATYFYTIFPSQYADTPEYLVELGPADLDALEQEHATMSQSFLLPARTRKLTFSGQYQLSPGGTQLDIEDSTRVALHLGSSASETYLFNVWLGVEPQVLFWKGFSYEASLVDIAPLLGKQTRLEFEAHTWDTIFDFDTVSLKATVCPEN